MTDHVWVETHRWHADKEPDHVREACAECGFISMRKDGSVIRLVSVGGKNPETCEEWVMMEVMDS